MHLGSNSEIYQLSGWRQHGVAAQRTQQRCRAAHLCLFGLMHQRITISKHTAFHVCGTPSSRVCCLLITWEFCVSRSDRMHEDLSRVILHIDFDCYYAQVGMAQQ